MANRLELFFHDDWDDMSGDQFTSTKIRFEAFIEQVKDRSIKEVGQLFFTYKNFLCNFKSCYIRLSFLISFVSLHRYLHLPSRTVLKVSTCMDRFMLLSASLQCFISSKRSDRHLYNYKPSLHTARPSALFINFAFRKRTLP